MPMRDHLQARHLLAQAEQLAGRGAGPGRPRQVDLRRAVSAAYYAVYHEVTLRSAAQIIGYDQTAVQPPAPPVAHLVRWFSHNAVAHAVRLTQQLASPEVDERWKPGRRAAWEVLHDRHRRALPAHLLRTVRRIRDLQERRVVADYDRVTPISRAHALSAVQQARGAIGSIAAHADDDPYMGFFALVALCSQRLPPGV